MDMNNFFKENLIKKITNYLANSTYILLVYNTSIMFVYLYTNFQNRMSF